MNHDPGRDAATYLSGAMHLRQETLFEEHLLSCDECWREVRDARDGRALAGSARELAPRGLRERVRSAVSAHPSARRRHRWLVPVAAVALTAAVAGFGFASVQSTRQPAAIAAALRDFRTGRLPAAEPRRKPPDLDAAGLHLAGRGSGQIGRINVDAFAYRDRRGRIVLLYLCDSHCPIPGKALPSPGLLGFSGARVGDVTLLYSQRPVEMLLVARGSDLIERAARMFITL